MSFIRIFEGYMHYFGLTYERGLLAREFTDYYIPMDGKLTKCEVEQYTCTEITADGVHPSPIGHRIIAEEYLRLLL